MKPKKAPKNNINDMMNEIETLCDAHDAQVTLSRAGGVWIGVVRLADGRSIQHQSPLDQQQLIADLLDALRRAVDVTGAA